MCEFDICCGLVDLELCWGGATSGPERNLTNTTNTEQPPRPTTNTK